MPEPEIVTKTEFAKLVGVSGPRVSQWLREQHLHGDAVVGVGHRARIRVETARKQLRSRLDVVQYLGANGRAKLDASASSPDALAIETEIKSARLRQLELANERASAEAAARSGLYTKTADARLEMGRVASRLMAIFEASFSEFANALAAAQQGTARDILRVLRSTWREIRVRQAKALGDDAMPLMPLVDEEASHAIGES